MALKTRHVPKRLGGRLLYWPAGLDTALFSIVALFSFPCQGKVTLVIVSHPSMVRFAVLAPRRRYCLLLTQPCVGTQGKSYQRRSHYSILFQYFAELFVLYSHGGALANLQCQLGCGCTGFLIDLLPDLFSERLCAVHRTDLKHPVFQAHGLPKRKGVS